MRAKRSKWSAKLEVMNERRGFHRLSNGDVQLTMQPDDYDRLLLVLGVATASLKREHSVLTADKVCGLMNRLLDGSPDFASHGVSEKERDHPYDEASPPAKRRKPR